MTHEEEEEEMINNSSYSFQSEEKNFVVFSEKRLSLSPVFVSFLFEIMSTRTRVNNEDPGFNAERNQSVIPQANERTWIQWFNSLDRKLSGSLLHFAYRSIDVLILIVGLSYGAGTCGWTNRFSITSICLLIFYFIDFFLIFSRFFKRNENLSEIESEEELRRISSIRGLIFFLKLIPVSFGLSYTFKSIPSIHDECALLRLTLGLVCFSTLLIVIIPPTKPEFPTRRSFSIECVFLLCLFTINGLYFGTLGSAMSSVNGTDRCFAQTGDDFYLRAPLYTFAKIGLILYGISTGSYIFNLFFCQISLRFIRSRRLFMSNHFFNYLINYFISMAIVYYLSFGSLLLFQPRSGEPCRTDAPTLYRTLIIWQWLRILTPLLAVPLILLLCCLGVFFGFILSYCLPASITVPILELLRVRD